MRAHGGRFLIAWGVAAAEPLTSALRITVRLTSATQASRKPSTMTKPDLKVSLDSTRRRQTRWSSPAGKEAKASSSHSVGNSPAESEIIALITMVSAAGVKSPYTVGFCGACSRAAAGHRIPDPVDIAGKTPRFRWNRMPRGCERWAIGVEMTLGRQPIIPKYKGSGETKARMLQAKIEATPPRLGCVRSSSVRPQVRKDFFKPY